MKKQPAKTIDIEILKNLGEFKAGQIVPVPADANGQPIARFWRMRLKDSPIDGFCQIRKDADKKSDKKSTADED